MNKLYYCKDCKRILRDSEKCGYCNSDNLKELTHGAPVNIRGSKLKGKVLKIKNNLVQLLIRDENNQTFIKEYGFDKLRKVL